MKIASCINILRHFLIHYLVVVPLALVSIWEISAQGAPAMIHPSRDYRLLSCEEELERQDFVVAQALEKLKDDSLLFVIVRQGNKESSNDLAIRRLHNVNRYFKERGSRLPFEKVLVAVGEPVPGFGRIEYYIFGQLRQVILYPQNGFICHSCCGPDKRYYPEKSKVLRRKK